MYKIRGELTMLKKFETELQNSEEWESKEKKRKLYIVMKHLKSAMSLISSNKSTEQILWDYITNYQDSEYIDRSFTDKALEFLSKSGIINSTVALPSEIKKYHPSNDFDEAFKFVENLC